MMTMRQTTLQRVTTDPGVDRSLETVAAIVGLSKATVTAIVEAGLPLMANVADEKPQVFAALFAQSAQPLPEPARVFYYAKLAHQARLDDFATLFGAQTAMIARETARQTGATEAQVSQVLATTMPAVIRALGKQNTGQTELGFGRQLRNVNA
jgi:hypothetical protein